MTGHRPGREDDSATGTEGRGTDEQDGAGTPRADVLFPVLNESELGGLRDVGQAWGRSTAGPSVWRRAAWSRREMASLAGLGGRQQRWLFPGRMGLEKHVRKGEPSARTQHLRSLCSPTFGMIESNVRLPGIPTGGIGKEGVTAAVLVERLFSSNPPPIVVWPTFMWMHKREYL